jgi:negative regulator of sigma E activity
VEHGERLSAYLAGDLDTDEIRALEAELARDPALRSRLARLRRLEQELAGMSPIDPPDGFSERLHTALREELAVTPLPGDELGARRAARRRRGMPAWVPAAASAAAVLAVVVGGVTVLSGGGDGDEEMATGAADMAESDSGAAGTAESLVTADTASGPVIVSMDVAYDATALESLPSAELFQGIVDEQLTDASAEELSSRFQSALPTDDSGDGATAAGEAGTEAATTEESTALSRSAAELQFVGEIPDEEALADISRCLPPLLESADTLIPVYAELATFEGEESVIYGFASPDPDSGEFTRIEVWAVSRADCAQLFFTQQDR